ncbi:Ankyrin repeat-containing protein [Mycena sanguinolenta]|uniref:Ankyrin repeat-containing protein n=1 Tax=Mycena sanguinolenta TaxID=230812 RepID=A0A8H7CX87_9AGAR|nr:Ankyrin repeat-containing protein [Mycena sanguinolenta]
MQTKLQDLFNNFERSAKSKFRRLTSSSQAKCVFTCRTSDLKGNSVDMTKNCTPCRYRFLRIDRSWREHEDTAKGLKLELYEFETLPDIGYCAVSHVWRGVQGRNNKHGYFSLKGQEDADDIGISVLYDISWASWERGLDYIWLDRSCIMQTNREDKSWQIRHMFGIYQKCSLCLVLPGGLQRLARMDENTTWADRAWTLQEIVAPPTTRVFVLYNPGKPDSTIQSRRRVHIETDNPVIANDSGRRALLVLAFALGQNHSKFFTESKFFGFQLSHLLTMGECLEGVTQKHHSWIWKSVIMRTSSRPVDMVCSIMGLFRVNFDPQLYDKDDRIGASIALVQSTLAERRNSEWQGIPYGEAHHPSDISWFLGLYWIDPDPEYSLFPRLPKTSVDGNAQWTNPDGSIVNVAEEFTKNIDFLKPDFVALVSNVALDDEGYLWVTSPHVLPLTRQFHRNPAAFSVPNNDVRFHFCPNTQTLWQFWPPDYATPREYWSNYLSNADCLAVYIGYIGLTDSQGLKPAVYLIIQRHAPERYHRVTYLHVPLQNGFPSFEPTPDMSFHNVRLAIGGPIPYRKPVSSDT